MDALTDLLSPFRLYDEPMMYQTLPNVVTENDRVTPTLPSDNPTPDRETERKEPPSDDRPLRTPEKE